MSDEENQGAIDFDKRWREFLKAHDDLRKLVKELAAENKALRKDVGYVSEAVCDLIQLGETITHMLQELLVEGVNVNSLKGVLGSAIKSFFNPYRKEHSK